MRGETSNVTQLKETTDLLKKGKADQGMRAETEIGGKPSSKESERSFFFHDSQQCSQHPLSATI